MGYITEWERCYDVECSRCESNNVEFIIWESFDGGNEDVKYKCNNCEKSWWVEGSDS